MHAGPRLARLSQYTDPSDPETGAQTPYTAAQYDQIRRRLENIFTAQLRLAFVF